MLSGSTGEKGMSEIRRRSFRVYGRVYTTDRRQSEGPTLFLDKNCFFRVAFVVYSISMN